MNPSDSPLASRFPWLAPLLQAVAEQAKKAGVFADVQLTDAALVCLARDQPAACYRLTLEPSSQLLQVGLFTADRWLSESIETDLLHTGDKLHELLEDELVELGWETSLPVEHFRSDAKEYVFQSSLALASFQGLPQDGLIKQAATLLLAYQAMFARLGDMTPSSP